MDVNGNFTQDDLKAVRTAIARGEKTVQFQDRTVTYRSMDELISAERFIVSELTTRPRQMTAYATKGLTTNGL